MQIKHNKTGRLLPAFIALAMLALSACGLGNADATPTLSVDAIYTAAYQTLAAQQATQLALTPPTETPSPTPLPSPTLIPTQSTPFGSPTTASGGGGASGCDSSVFVSDVTVPDGTVMAPGQSFVKTWAVMNNGTCAWSTSYKLAFISGEQMDGSSVSVPSSVPAGQQAQLSVNLTAPITAGDYTGYWRLQNDKGEFFGNSVYVTIKVSGGSSTSSAATDTPEPSATP